MEPVANLPARQEIPDRITVVEMIYYQPANGQPFSFESKFSSPCDTNEQPYVRYSKVTEKWTKLDLGWLNETAGVIVISNEEGKNLQTNPTEDEKKAIASRVVEICHDGDSYSFIIPPKESIRIRTEHGDKLLICCCCGTAKIAVCALPR